MKKRFAITAGLIGIGCLIGIAASESRTVGKLEFSRFGVRHHENGKISRGKLKKPQMVGGLECKRWVHFHENGRAIQMQLAKAATVQKVPVMADSTVFFTPDGKLRMVWFAKDTKLNRVIVRGGAKISTGFHPNGKLASCFLRDDTVIDGMPVRASVFKPVFFHDNGRLKSATLAKDTVVQEVAYEKGDTVRLNADGKLARK